MAGWNHDNANWKLKECKICKKEFKPRSGVHKFCSEKCKGKWQYHPDNIEKKDTVAQYKEISGNWNRYLARLLYYGGRKRDQLTREDLLNQLKKQHYRCALSGERLTCLLEKGTKFPTNVSVDRIQAGGQYTPDNIQLVCRALNHWRSDTSVEDFITWCSKVAEYNKSRKEGT